MKRPSPKTSIRSTSSRQEIREIREMVVGIKEVLDRNVAQCEVCRHIVLGNGQEPLAVRVARIEEDKRIGGWLITKILAAAGVVASVFGAVTSIVWRHFAGK